MSGYGAYALVWALPCAVALMAFECNVDAIVSRTARKNDDVVFMLYLSGDNSKEEDIVRVINVLEKSEVVRTMPVVLLVDRAVGYYGGLDDWSDTRAYEVAHDGGTSTMSLGGACRSISRTEACNATSTMRGAGLFAAALATATSYRAHLVAAQDALQALYDDVDTSSISSHETWSESYYALVGERGVGAVSGGDSYVSTALYSYTHDAQYARTPKRDGRGEGHYAGTAYGVDMRGSVVAMYERGTRAQQYHYTAYGVLYSSEAVHSHADGSDIAHATARGYNGKPSMAGGALYNYGYRDYDPTVGAFLTQDPIRDGSNWYAYVGGDPINFIDPLGLFPQAVVGAVIGATTCTERPRKPLCAHYLRRAFWFQ